MSARVPVWKRTLPKNRWRLALSKKNRQALLRILGVMLALVTFFLTDHFREKSKDLVDSIDMAENMFVSRVEAARLQVQLAHLDSNLVRQFEALTGHAADRRLLTAAAAEHLIRNPDVVSALCGQYLDWLENVDRLAERLPESETYLIQAQGLRRMVRLLVDRTGDAARAAEKAQGDDTPENRNLAEMAIDTMTLMNGNVSDEIQNLGRRVLRQAHNRSAENERAYGRLTVWRSILVPLGVILSLLGLGAKEADD